LIYQLTIKNYSNMTKQFIIRSKANNDWTFEGSEGWVDTSKCEPSVFTEEDANWIMEHFSEEEKEIAEMVEVEPDYRVQTIYRNGGEVERVIADCCSYHEAKQIYDSTNGGMEIYAQIVSIASGDVILGYEAEDI
jgi:hypothetical protein